MEVSPDGTIVEVETMITEGSLPGNVSRAIAKAARKGKIVKVEQCKIYAVKTLVKLPSPSIVYEAKIARDGGMIEVEVAADGTILEIEEEEDDDDHDDHDGDDDHDDHDDDDDDDDK